MATFHSRRIIGVLGVLLAAAAARGQSTWSNPAGGTWNTASNWVDTMVPAPGATTQLVFESTSAAGYTATNDIGAFVLNGLTFNNTGTGALILNSAAAANTITLGGTGAFITATGSGAETLSSELIYGVNSTVTNSGTGLLTLGGKNTFSAGTTTTFSGTGNITIGTTTGASLAFGSGTTTVIYNGSGAFTMADAGSYSGTGTINLSNAGTGTFSIGNVGPLSGTLKINAGVVKFAGNTGGDLFGNNIILDVATGATFDFAGNGESMGAIQGGGIIKGANISMNKTGTFTWGGSIQGTNSFATNAANVNYNFTGDNTSTGTSTIASGSLFSIGTGGTTGSISGNLVNNGTTTINRSNDWTYTKVISGTGTLEKKGAGTVTLAGTSTYTGATTVTGGTLRVYTNTTPRDYTVKNTAKLSVVNTSPGLSFTMQNLTLGAAGASTTLGLEYSVNGFSGGTGATIDIGAALTANGTVHVSVGSDIPMVTGTTIPLIKYGSIAGDGFAAFQAGTLSLPQRTTGALVHDDINRYISLNVIMADSVKWNGDLSNIWDSGSAINVGGTSNFKLASDSTPTNFVARDVVMFDDSATGNFTVDIPANVAPITMTVNNSSNAYIFQGAGGISGTTAINKLGSGTMTVLNANTNSGAVNIGGGVLQVGNGGTTGSLGTGAVIVGGTLEFNRSDDIVFTNAFGGTGVINKNGAGKLTLPGSNNAFTGTLNINAGTVLLDDSTGTGGDLGAGAINVNSGGKFIFGLGNPDFPDTTYLTINTGGEAQFLAGEQFGGIRLAGGVYRLTGANAGQSSSMNGTTGSFLGYALESGSIIAENTGTGAATLTGSQANPVNKTTPGTVTFSGKVVFSAATPINIKEGKLSFDAINFQSGGTEIVTLGDAATAGTLELTGPGAVTQVRPLAIASGGGAVNVADAAGSVTVAGLISGSGTLTKSGLGTIAITPSASFTGKTTVTQGILRVAPGIAGGEIELAGGRLVVTNTTTPATLTLPALTLPASGGNIAFELLSVGNPVIPLLSVTGVDMLKTNGGTHALSISTTDVLSPGTITLIDYDGAPIVSGFTLGTIPARTLASLNYNAVNTSVDLVVTGVDTVKWTGGISGTWDVGTAIDVGGTNNWKISSGAATNFFTGDRVGFDDTATGNFTVQIPATVLPASVTINNATNGYTFTGTGDISGAAVLNKLGAGTLVVANNNTYTGLTTITAGTLQIGDGGTTGSVGTGDIVNSGTLAIHRSDDVAMTNAISGTGNIVKAAGDNTVTLNGAVSTTGNLAIQGGTLVLGSASSYTFGGTSSGAGALVKSGAGTMTLTSDLAHTGGTTIAGGAIRIGDGGTAGSLAGNVSLASGTTLSFNRSDDILFAGAISGTGGISTIGGAKLTLTGNLNYTGTTAITAGSLEIKNSSPATLNSAIAVNANTLTIAGESELTLGGAISSATGVGNIVKNGPAPLTLLGNSGFTGTFTINQGTVLLDDLGGGGDLNAGNIIINTGGKFIFGANGNADLPDATLITVNTGAEFELRQGENFGGIILQGGTYRMSGKAAAINTTAISTTVGYSFQSGTVIAQETGTGVGTLTGSVSLVKTTPGTVTFTGPVAIASAVPIVIGEGTLSFDATNIPAAGTAGITLGTYASATLQMTGPGSASSSRGVQIDNNSGTFDVVDPAGSLTLSSLVSGAGNLTKTGAGTLSMSASTTLTGAINISQGNLRMGSAIGNSPINVAAGARLTVVPDASLTSLSVPSVSLDAGGAAIAFELPSSTLPTSPLLVVTATDGLNLNAGAHTIRVVCPPGLSVGQFTLIDYESATAISSGFSIASLPVRTTASLVYDTAGTKIDLNVTAIDSTLWSGATTGIWDTGTAENVGGTNNWKLASNSAATNFVVGDRVTFDDTAAGNFTIDIPANVEPNLVTFNNSTSDYKLTGLGGIAGSTGLTKSGAGKLTIANDNTYTGLTTVSGGTLQIGDIGTTGSVAGAVTVEAGGTVLIGGTGTGGSVGGILTVNAGGAASIGSGGTSGSVGGNIVVGGAAVVTFNRSDDVSYAKVISGTGTINKTGPGQLTLLANNNPFTGTLNINQGTVLLDDLGGGGDLGAASIVINNTGAFIFGEHGNTDFPSSTFVTVNTGGTFTIMQGETYGGVFLKGGTLKMAGTVKTGVNSDGAGVTGHTLESGFITTDFTSPATGGAITGAGGLTKITPGTVDITGTVSFGSALQINIKEGTLAMNVANVPATGNGTVTLAMGDATTAGTLKVKDAGAATIIRPIVMTGGGTIDTADAAGVITLSNVISGTGDLTKAGPGSVAITGAANTHTGNVVITGGTLRLDGTLPTSAAAKVQGGNLEIRTTQTLNALEITGGSATLTAPVSGTGKVVPTVKSLAISAAGKLDVGNSGLIVDYDATSAAESVRIALASAYNSGNWNGAGITSAAAIATPTDMAVGYAEAADLGNPSTFLGAAVPDATAILVRMTITGDSNLDGIVNFDDLVAVAQNYESGSGKTWTTGDFNYDGQVTFDDLVTVAQHYEVSLGGAAASFSMIPGSSGDFSSDWALAQQAAVPEPGTISLLAIGSLLLMRRNRRGRFFGHTD